MDTALSMQHSVMQLTFGFVALKEWPLSKLKESCYLSSVWKMMFVYNYIPKKYAGCLVM